MQIWAESGKSALPICNYSQILYQFLTFTQNLKRSHIILICYYLKLLKVSKTEIKSFIREFEKITREYESSVNPNVSAISIHPDLFSRLNILKNSI